MIYCYSLSIFENQDKVKKFICPIGKGILKDPVFTPCGHLFCQMCIQYYMNQPHKQEGNIHSIYEQNIININDEYDNPINSYIEDDDEFTDEEQVINDQKQQSCPICKKDIPKINLTKAFIVNNFLNDELVKCPKECGWKGPLEQLKQHNESNQYCSIEKIKELKIKLSNQDNQIQNLENKIEELNFLLSIQRSSMINQTYIPNCTNEGFTIESGLKLTLPFQYAFHIKESKQNFMIGFQNSSKNLFILLKDNFVVESNFLESQNEVQEIFIHSSLVKVLFQFKIDEELNELEVQIQKNEKCFYKKKTKINNILKNAKFSVFVKNFSQISQINQIKQFRNLIFDLNERVLGFGVWFFYLNLSQNYFLLIQIMKFRDYVKEKNFDDIYTIAKKQISPNNDSIRLVYIKGQSIRRLAKIIDKNDVELYKNSIKEYKHLIQIDHPNIIKVLDVIDERDYLYVILEYCQGGEMLDQLLIKKYHTEEQSLYYLKQLVRTLMFFKKNKLILRNLKLENLFLMDDEINTLLKVVDLNEMVKVKNYNLENNQNIQSQENIIQDYYNAPDEQITGKYDVWALGICLYLLNCGYPPFEGINIQQDLQKVEKKGLDFSGIEWQDKERAKNLASEMIKNEKTRIDLGEIYSKLNENQIEVPINELIESMRQFSKLCLLDKILIYQSLMYFQGNKKEFYKYFDHFEHNNSGYVNFDSFSRIIGEKINSKKEIKSLFKSISIFGQSTLSFSEFLSSISYLNLKFLNFNTIESLYFVIANEKGNINSESFGKFLNFRIHYIKNSDKIITQTLKEFESVQKNEFEFDGFLNFYKKRFSNIFKQLQKLINQLLKQKQFQQLKVQQYRNYGQFIELKCTSQLKSLTIFRSTKE